MRTLHLFGHRGGVPHKSPFAALHRPGPGPRQRPGSASGAHKRSTERAGAALRVAGPARCFRCTPPCCALLNPLAPAQFHTLPVAHSCSSPHHPSHVPVHPQVAALAPAQFHMLLSTLEFGLSDHVTDGVVMQSALEGLAGLARYQQQCQATGQLGLAAHALPAAEGAAGGAAGRTVTSHFLELLLKRLLLGDWAQVCVCVSLVCRRRRRRAASAFASAAALGRGGTSSLFT